MDVLNDRISVISDTKLKLLNEDLQSPIEYRKSGLSLNHIIGCPLDCTYCVRHVFNNYDMRKPHRLCTDEEAVDLLLNNKYFIKHKTPLQLFNRATDPFLPNVKRSTFKILSMLAERGLNNTILIITRYRVSEEDAKKLNEFLPLKLVLLVTHSGIDDREIEPIKSEIAIKSLKNAFKHSVNYKVILYWRPIVAGLNDSDAHIKKAAELSNSCHAVAFTGLFFRDEIKKYFVDNGIPSLYDDVARRKILPENQEKKILDGFYKYGGINIFRKTSCAISFSYKVPDYNGHYGITELCDICPSEQIKICKTRWKQPQRNDVDYYLKKIELNKPFDINNRAIVFESLKEQDRYFIQHNLQYQAHDKSKKHFKGQHGRANIGWETNNNEYTK